jgi:hypothetical protein
MLFIFLIDLIRFLILIDFYNFVNKVILIVVVSLLWKFCSNIIILLSIYNFFAHSFEFFQVIFLFELYKLFMLDLVM